MKPCEVSFWHRHGDNGPHLPGCRIWRRSGAAEPAQRGGRGSDPDYHQASSSQKSPSEDSDAEKFSTVTSLFFEGASIPDQGCNQEGKVRPGSSHGVSRPSGRPRGVGEHVLSSRSLQVRFCDLVLLPLPQSERVRSFRDLNRILCHSCALTRKMSRTHLGHCDGHTSGAHRFLISASLAARSSPNGRYLRPYATGLNLDFGCLAEHHTLYTL